MVKLGVVENPMKEAGAKPIGIIAALTDGFDRMAASPLLILPPLLLDLLLWFGPHLSISALIPQGTSWLGLPLGGEGAVVEQVAALEEMLSLLRERYNLMVALSILPAGMVFNLFVASASLPAGLPSLMAARLPIDTPMGSPSVYLIRDPWLMGLTWLVLTLTGLGLGTLYHRWLVRQRAPDAKLGSGWVTWKRMILLYLAAYFGGLILLAMAVFAATLVGLFIPLLGTGVLFVGLSLLFWAALYFTFTAHGIVRYRFGLWRAMLESAAVVRSNLLSTVGFLFLSFGITWFATNLVWSLPEPDSWYTLLALLGHAFVSGTLLSASYAFYQGRRTWVQRMRVALRRELSEGSEPPETRA